MTTSSNDRMTLAEVTAFAQKVEDWSRGLSAKEQEFLAEIIARAATTEASDVRGYSVDRFLKVDMFLQIGGVDAPTAPSTSVGAASDIGISPATKR